MAVESYHYDLMREAMGEAEAFPGSKDILDKFGIPWIDLADDRSIAMMKSWRSNPANERLWQGDIGN
ncbi:hypothetical protein Q2941_46525 [Bradyrhizobium sp. UFLA05-153]